MIKIKVVAPNESGETEDFTLGIWRVYFEDPNFLERKSAYVTKNDLKFKEKIDPLDIENVRQHLNKWSLEYIKDKKFINLEDNFHIK